MTRPLLGVVADDLTGACDLAGGVADAGLRTSVTLGVPTEPIPSEVDCAVVALKSRTVEPATAVEESAAAARALAGVRYVYHKYCSTFDSTAEGNIGPVADALVELAGPGAISVGTPATPQVGRTQYLGHLFVDGRLLSESSLRNHPLTPMTHPDLVRVLARQTDRSVGLIDHPVVRRGPTAIADAVAASRGVHRHLLVDATDDADLDHVAEAVLRLERPVVIGGAAGLAVALARTHFPGTSQHSRPSELPQAEPGPRLIISGSGSERTREQVAAFRGQIVRVDPLALAADSSTIQRLTEQLEEAVRRDDSAVLLSATAAPSDVRDAQTELGKDKAAALVEDALAQLAVTAVGKLGVRRMIVAGGETSGAVAAALGAKTLRIGALAAPGVPWTVTTVQDRSIALLLKSGNFGDPDLFETAWTVGP
ncbi:four-carbon acid sugar kinase family protein [Kribbella turkmenica]|uniref:3-oxo-tetronate kinase n=1 Tax=Kribbella turkmenica TaxID=2530375 RepID=A0A4R4WKE6_9ACTN|nr:3-oxo-tetronate kinase [Kribbella turkmenica]TDD19502.1 four-carbon acid sugar kinase family protein [Kribbella turkmenica]